MQCGSVVSCFVDLLGFAAETAPSPHLGNRRLRTRALCCLSVLLGSVCNRLFCPRLQLGFICVSSLGPRMRSL